ncbi:MAG: phosphotransferase [Pseudomonadota bacterium]
MKRADIALNGRERPSALRTVVDWLSQQTIPSGDVTLLHNDFKLDNMILDPATLAPRAVIDWDMGSRGDPLFDVATLLSYWTEPDDPPCMHRLAQMPTAAPGFLSRSEALIAYSDATGRDVSAFAFYRILTMFKLSVVFLQLDTRQSTSGVRDARLAALSGLGDELMAFTCDLLTGGRDPGDAL